MIPTMLRLVIVLVTLIASRSQDVAISCPETIGKQPSFSVTTPTAITIGKTSGVGSLCTLTLELDNGSFIPIARTYDGNDWERAGGTFTNALPDWLCSGTICSSTIPPGSKYVLQTRSTSLTINKQAEVARFLESASFGAKPTDLTSWGDKSFAQYIKDQVNTPMTSHRELFRRLANPRWTFNKPEFAGRLDPCAPNSTWRRQVLTTKDRKKLLTVRKVDDRWEVKIDGHIRTMVRQLRFVNAVKGQNDTISDGGSYEVCSTEEEILRGIFKVKIRVNCRQLMEGDLMVDFPDSFTPSSSIEGLIPSLAGSNMWQSISSRNPEYMFKNAMFTTTTSTSPAAVSANTLVRTTSTTRPLGSFFCRPYIYFLFGGLLCPVYPIPVPRSSPVAPPSIKVPVVGPIAPPSTALPGTTAPKSLPVASPSTKTPTIPVPVVNPTASPLTSSPVSTVPQSSPIFLQSPVVTAPQSSPFASLLTKAPTIPAPAVSPTSSPLTASPISSAPQSSPSLILSIAPSSQAPALRTIVPQSTAPQSVAPQSAAPQSAAPQSAAPQLAAPQLAAPQSTAAPILLMAPTTPGPTLRPIAPQSTVSPIATAPVTTQNLFCKVASSSSIVNTPLFARTSDGIWLQYDPRISMEVNTINQPLLDGGLGLLLAKKTSYCSTAARTFLNENKCIMSPVPSCLPGSTNASVSMTGAIICGSPGEIDNDLTQGDNWLDVSSIDDERSAAIGLPVDSTSAELFGRQREFIWSEASIKATDQLRQRISFALLHIFSLPKISINGEAESTESFLIYYDIFVRHAFGNYGDIMREISFSPLNAESLSYLESISVAHALAGTKTIVFPDENYARELMQLFTVGLFELNMDGTPVTDTNGVVQTYTSEDVLSFAKIWTAFRRNSKRANVESNEIENRYDPMRLEAIRRDRFPKTDLANGYIGDFYPLCADLPSRSFLRSSAKYRLLGSSRLPELKKQTWKVTQNTQTLTLESGSDLYNKLCAPSQGGVCSYPSLVVLETNLACNGLECNVDTIHVLQVGSVFYEYVQSPCVEQPFFMNGIKTLGKGRSSTTVCTNPSLSVASEACCLPNITVLTDRKAIPSCLISGEQMSRDTAQIRCASIGRNLCDYNSMTATEKCPLVGFHWTSEGCIMRVKVSSDGHAAIVHDYLSASVDLRKNTPSYFKVYWENDQYPMVENSCGQGQCEVYENTCICNVTVTNDPVFSVPPTNAAEILLKLRIGHPDPTMYDANYYISTVHNDYKSYSTTQNCCSIDSFFEVKDRNEQTKFLRNLNSTVTIAGTTFKFRNPPQFNSVLSPEYSVANVHYETEAVLDHLLYHQNTPPFVAYRFIQRFGVSNPTPRYVSTVANAFKSGRYSDGGLAFGQGRYGDMEATIAAVLLDREARSIVLDKDPAQGALREPILKVLSFMRATDFKSSVPLVELDFMDMKIGQMAYEQGSVFSFFRPEYSPSELSGTGLTAPESQSLSSTTIVSLLNGLYSLIKYGLNECNGGFGAYGDCSRESGKITAIPNNTNSLTEMVQGLSNILTGGRMAERKQQAIVNEIANQANATSSYQLALQLIASSPEFHSTSSMDILAPAEEVPKIPATGTPPTPGYKVVIHFFLRGGCDSFNVLVPASSCGTLYQEYVSARGTIGLQPNETLPLSGDAFDTQQPCSSFSVHSGLPTIQKLYDAQDLLFMANVGVLTQYVNRSDYSFRTETPLFSHNSMQDEVAKLDPLKLIGGTGALGRMADVLQSKGYMTGRTAIDSPSSNLASRSGATPPIVTVSRRGFSLFNVDPSSPTMNSTVQQLNDGTSGIYGDLWSTLMKRAINQTDELFGILKNTQPTTIFPSTPLGGRLKIASQMIASRVARGVDRDVFFIPFDGFDSHSGVADALRTRFLEMNDALEDFVAELKLLGVWDDVAIIQTSDFGRTMTGNSGGGSDHGWGGNYWLAGGGVNGRRIVGKYPPTFSLDYEYNIDRGRLIPTTSWDSIFNSISEWMGIDNESELVSVLPNRRKFNDVFPASTLFQ